MGWPLRLFLLTVILGPPATAAVVLVDGTPTVARPGKIDIAVLDKARALADRYDPRHLPNNRITEIKVTGDELNTLMKGALNTTDRIAGRFDVTEDGVTTFLTVELKMPKFPFGRFVNIRTVVAPSARGLEFSRLSIGSLDVPASLIGPVVTYGLNELVGEDTAGPILDSVTSVKIEAQTITVAFRPPTGLGKDLATSAVKRVAVSDPRRVRAYYDTVDRTVSRLPQGGRISLIEIMRPVFKLARERSAAGDPVRENEAAMLAIAIYFGDARFERFVGEVLTSERKSRRRHVGQFRLDGRHDFVQHFAISMGLVLTSGDFAANIIGELKEAQDSRKSSGFSFTDIGADRAGVQFAKRAVADRATADRMQRILSEARDERVFFPRFADLPEGMRRAVFQHRYGDVGSTAYNSVIAEIDRRIAQARVFR